MRDLVGHPVSKGDWVALPRRQGSHCWLVIRKISRIENGVAYYWADNNQEYRLKDFVKVDRLMEIDP